MENIGFKLAHLAIIVLPLTLQAETFLECSELENSSDRLNCYDSVAAGLKASLQQKQKGTTKERQEAKEVAVSVATIGKESVPSPELESFKIERIISPQRHRHVYISDDGRKFKKTSRDTQNFKIGDTVFIKPGVFGSIFLVKPGLKIKVKEI